MPRWIVSVPVWGERCVEVFCATALPALEQAMLCLQASSLPSWDGKNNIPEPILIAHTDQPHRIRGAATQIRVDTRPVPAGLREFDCLSQAHREVLSVIACRGDVVVLLTADLVISRSGLRRCYQILSDTPKMLVLCAGVRACQEGHMPDTGVAANLMNWAWNNRHPMTSESVWPDGKSVDLSRMYFESEEGNVVARLCLPHPLAVRIDGRPLRFTPTIDANLMQNFSLNELHVETSSKHLALVELSPRDKGFDLAQDTIEYRVRGGEVRIKDPVQAYCANRRVVLRGVAEGTPDVEVFGAIIDSDEEEG